MTHWTDTFSTRLSHRRARGSWRKPARSTASGPAGIVVRMIRQLILWQDRANSRHQLAQLDDRLLKDIGISRVDALHEAAKPFWRS
jgi:uncharacterized protein YjiS (DUF1127 family)